MGEPLSSLLLHLHSLQLPLRVSEGLGRVEGREDDRKEKRMTGRKGGGQEGREENRKEERRTGKKRG